MKANSFQLGSCEFSNFDKSLFEIDTGSYYFYDALIHDSLMVWQHADTIFQVNSVIFGISEANVTIEKSVVRGIHSEYSSPVLYMHKDSVFEEQVLLEVIESSFLGNDANVQGGVLSLVNTDAYIYNSTFADNRAGIEGGALFLSCEVSALRPCAYDISLSTFSNNSARDNGGAIKYDFYKPTLAPDNVFSDNSATYGPNIASYPVEIKMVRESL
mmetsp:Transcript_10414/g.10443  ORF Transcript_10414/g.10443 Transcript_10414/m.10443 type:complete len:215 (-) Transcript_10414:1955-2599(-)